MSCLTSLAEGSLQLHFIRLYLGVALSHDVIDVSLQCHAYVLSLCCVELEDVQNSCNPHLEENRLTAAAKLHDVSQLGRV